MRENWDNRWQDLFMFLRSKGFEVYAPGQHRGDTLSPYIVVKLEQGAEANRSIDRQVYSLLIYIPESRYSALESFVRDVEKAMLEVRPLFERYSTHESPVYDEASKGYYTRVLYHNFRKRELR